MGRLSLIFALMLGLATSALPAGTDVDAGEDDPNSTAILDNYLKASQEHPDGLRGASMEVQIEARVPKLKENATLRALRKISRVGQITYRVLSFQGDNTVKSQVIARYLQAEQQGQGDNNIAITPQNYKFKYKGLKHTDDGLPAYVFQLSPHKKRIGLFKGELWLDTKTYLPLLEKGRLVKNPSIFFKKVDFERAFAIRNGYSVPSYMMSTIDTRIIGKVELNISYSKFAQDDSLDSGEAAAAEPAILHSNLRQ